MTTTTEAPTTDEPVRALDRYADLNKRAVKAGEKGKAITVDGLALADLIAELDLTEQQRDTAQNLSEVTARVGHDIVRQALEFAVQFQTQGKAAATRAAGAEALYREWEKSLEAHGPGATEENRGYHRGRTEATNALGIVLGLRDRENPPNDG